MGTNKIASPAQMWSLWTMSTHRRTSSVATMMDEGYCIHQWIWWWGTTYTTWQQWEAFPEWALLEMDGSSNRSNSTVTYHIWVPQGIHPLLWDIDSFPCIQPPVLQSPYVCFGLSTLDMTVVKYDYIARWHCVDIYTVVSCAYSDCICLRFAPAFQ